MHLLPGIVHVGMNTGGIVQATRSACGPLLNVAPIRKHDDAKYDANWAQHCIAFNDSVLGYLKRTSSIKIVVLSSLFLQYLDSGRYQLFERTGDAPAYSVVDTQQDLVLKGLKATIDAVRTAGKKIVIIAPPPQSGLDIGRCTERLQRGLPVLGVLDGCRINRAAYERTRKSVLDLLDATSASADIGIIRFDPFLCHSGGCDTYKDDTLLYRDSGHLSIQGSAWIADKVRLMDQIEKQAR